MIINELGVVLRRSNAGENDRLVWIYTERLGKVSVRFRGVNKPAGRLKCLAEPLVLGEFRLHLNPRNETLKGIGGRIVNGFPTVRADFRLTASALLCCEMLDRVTAQGSPNVLKFRLLVAALESLAASQTSEAALPRVGARAASSPPPWLVTAFGLKLLELAGVSMKASVDDPYEASLWRLLHETDLSRIAEVPEHPAAASLADRMFTHLESHAGRPLRSRSFLERVGALPAAREAIDQALTRGSAASDALGAAVC